MNLLVEIFRKEAETKDMNQIANSKTNKENLKIC